MEQGAAVEWLLQALAGCARREVLSRPAVITATEVFSHFKRGIRRPAGPVHPLDRFPQPASRYLRTCPGVRSESCNAEHRSERGQGGHCDWWDAPGPFRRWTTPFVFAPRHSTICERAWWCYVPTGARWSTSLDARRQWGGGANGASPGGPVTDLPRAQGAACADSSTDNEDGGAADCIATTRPSTAPTTSAVSLLLVQEAGPLALWLQS